jgi:hypothetical protein
MRTRSSSSTTCRSRCRARTRSAHKYLDVRHLRYWYHILHQPNINVHINIHIGSHLELNQRRRVLLDVIARRVGSESHAKELLLRLRSDGRRSLSFGWFKKAVLPQTDRFAVLMRRVPLKRQHFFLSERRRMRGLVEEAT